MNITTTRLLYARCFVVCLLGVSLYITTQSLAGGTAQFEDNLWGRKSLVSYFNNLRLALGDQVFGGVFVSKDGWLSIPAHLNSYQNIAPTSSKVLQRTQQKIQALYTKLRAENITFILVIPPNKTTIYPDKLPGQIINKESKLDAFKNYLNKYGPPVLVDLRPVLRNGRKTQNVYEKTGTHWNAYGAFIAYTEIMKEVAKTYPQLAPRSINDFKISTSQPYMHDIAASIGGTSVLESAISFTSKENTNVHWSTLNDDEPAVPLQISTTPNQNLPTLLMYMDSFGYRMQDFIAPHFSKATFILNRSKYPDLKSMEIIRAIKPNIVIIEFVERFFDNGSAISEMEMLLNDLLEEKN